VKTPRRNSQKYTVCHRVPIIHCLEKLDSETWRQLCKFKS